MLRDTPAGQEFKGQISLAQHDNLNPLIPPYQGDLCVSRKCGSRNFPSLHREGPGEGWIMNSVKIIHTPPQLRLASPHERGGSMRVSGYAKLSLSGGNQTFFYHKTCFFTYSAEITLCWQTKAIIIWVQRHAG